MYLVKGDDDDRCDESAGCDTVAALTSEIHAVRCCSDSEISGWRQKASCSVWSESNVWNEGCQQLNWNDANDFCISKGGRLCSREELETPCAAETGCQFDWRLVWSSTSFSEDGCSYSQTSGHNCLNYNRITIEGFRGNDVTVETCQSLCTNHDDCVKINYYFNGICSGCGTPSRCYLISSAANSGCHWSSSSTADTYTKGNCESESIEYEVVYEDEHTTCSSEYVISQAHGHSFDITISDCQQACSEHPECQYAFLNTYPSCYLYTECSQTRSPAHSGTTWRKVREVTTAEPTLDPVTSRPTDRPTRDPVTSRPTNRPTFDPVTSRPTDQPTNDPTNVPTLPANPVTGALYDCEFGFMNGCWDNTNTCASCCGTNKNRHGNTCWGFFARNSCCPEISPVFEVNADGEFTNDLIQGLEGSVSRNIDVVEWNGLNAAYISGDRKYIEWELDVGPSSMPQLTLEVLVWIPSISNNRGWIFGDENGGCDRYILLHDDRVGGFAPSCKFNPGLGNVPTGEWVHLITTYDQETGATGAYMNGHGSSRTSGVTHNSGNQRLRIGSPWPNHYGEMYIAGARAYGSVLSLNNIEARYEAAQYKVQATLEEWTLTEDQVCDGARTVPAGYEDSAPTLDECKVSCLQNEDCLSINYYDEICTLCNTPSTCYQISQDVATASSFSFCDNLANDLGGDCIESDGSFTITASGGLTYRDGGMDNDGGGFYTQNICLVALYGENASSYSSKGTYSSGDYTVGGGAWRHIHGISNNRLDNTGTLDAIGFFLGGCCYTSWTRVTCRFTDYPAISGGCNWHEEEGVNTYTIVTDSPTASPTTSRPTNMPTLDPTTSRPTKMPTLDPTTSRPTEMPTLDPTTSRPTEMPSLDPTTSRPTEMPTLDPTTSRPTEVPTWLPTTDEPTKIPSMDPTTEEPTNMPTNLPTTDDPTHMPTELPTTDTPTHMPTALPTTDTPTQMPSEFPTTDDPTSLPSTSPSHNPSEMPSNSCSNYVCTEEMSELTTQVYDNWGTINERMDNMATGLSESFGQLQETINAHESTITTLQSDLQEADSEIATANANAEVLTQRVMQLESLVNTLFQRMEGAAANLNGGSCGTEEYRRNLKENDEMIDLLRKIYGEVKANEE